MFAELADEPKFVAIKESSDNVRRITDIRNLCGDRYAIFSGVDDLAYGGFLLGAVGWVAGLVDAFPRETVAIYRLIRQGKYEDALRIFNWFMPVLHLDTDIKFVHYIKLAESMTGLGTETVRPPRLNLVGEERERISGIIAEAIRTRPILPEF
jgi:1-pyrroline-4-hydroxy-2-carboxylate deaminase